MKQFLPSENDEQDQEVIKLLQELRSFEPEYPPELLAARREAFLAQFTQIEPLGALEVEGGVAPRDQEIINIFGALKAAEAEYPLDLLAARRSTFLHQIETAKKLSPLDKLRASIQGIFPGGLSMPGMPLRTSLVVASLIAAALIASLFFSQAGQLLRLSPSQLAAQPTRPLPTTPYEVAIRICKPDDRTPACPPLGLDPSQDLADQANGVARPAVSKDASSGSEGVHQAGYVNDGRSGASWVSKSADSWVKIDLGKVRTINSVSLHKGSPDSSQDNNLGQFVIAVASSDVYADGNSSNDYTEYAQVFNSEQTGFSGTVSHAETIRTLFPPVKARYVKITFEKAGAAIDEVGVFMVQPPVLAEQPTTVPKDDVPELTSTLVPTNTLAPADTATPAPTGTQLPTETPSAIPTEPWIASPTNTLPPTGTATPLPTNTLPPTAADTPTPVPTKPLPSDTPIPTFVVVPPTAIPPTVQLPSASTDPIIIAGSGQTLTFTCNGNAVEVRGQANTVTLLGSCSSITVSGNGNIIFWQSGAPVITNKGTENIISQR